MAFDKRSNFAYSTVKVAPVPATSGITLSVQTGDGTLFNATPPYNAIVFPNNANPTKANAEIVRITAISIDTFTITRTQETSSARSIATGDQILAGLTDKTLSDIETAVNTNTAATTTNLSSITAVNNLLNGTNTGVTLNQPTIANFTNAQHDHSTASQGGSLGTGVVQGPNISNSAITLGYAQITAISSGTTSTTAVAVTGLSVTVTVPTGGRRVKVTFNARDLQSTGASYVSATIWDGGVGTGTQIGATQIYASASTLGQAATCIAVVTPSSGTRTYGIGLQTTASTATIEAAATYPAFILVEAI